LEDPELEFPLEYIMHEGSLIIVCLFVCFWWLQGQRLLQLATSVPAPAGRGGYNVLATAPPTSVIAPSAYYMLFAVSDGFPSVAQWVHIG
jgi:hypothetical protein